MFLKSASLHPVTPFTCSISYIIYSIYQNIKLKNTKPRERKLFSLLTFVMVLHNAVLCMFSLITFIKTFPIILKALLHSPTIMDFINDRNSYMITALEPWTWIFYVSKIYEIFDSIILHINRRPTTVLQMYHHSGAIVCCWALCRCETHLPWIFVVLNSFIHTIMYFYYMLTTIKIRPPFKRIITRLQIGQFVVGTSLLIGHAIFNDQWSNDKNLFLFQCATLVSNFVYVIILFFMFRRFEKQTYAKAKKD